MEGRVVATHIRVEGPEGKRFFWSRDGAAHLGGLPVTELPLYNTERLREVPEEYAPVWLVEGEKAADALVAVGHVALGTVTGAGAAPSDRVLSCLQGREVTLWPDNDEAGLLHMAVIARGLIRCGARVRVLDVQAADLADKSDAADVVAIGGVAAVDQLYISHTQPHTLEKHGLVATLEEVAARFPATRWLWPGWLPRGYMTILAGNPGAGKSGIALALASTYLAGGDWPDGTPSYDSDVPPELRRVLWLETEDSHGILRDRCHQWGVGMSNILLWGADGLQRPDLSKEGTATALVDVVRENVVSLVIVDTLAGSHYEDENSANIKVIMQCLTRVASECGVAVLAVHHLRKRSQTESEAISLDRVRGSSAIAASARVVLAVWPDDTTEKTIFMACIKNNMAVPPGLVVSEMGAEGPIFRPGPLGVAPTAAPPHQTDRAEAVLRELLADGEWHDSADIKAAAARAGVSERYFYYARRVLCYVRQQGRASMISLMPEGGVACGGEIYPARKEKELYIKDKALEASEEEVLEKSAWSPSLILMSPPHTEGRVK